jgi:hypothetical protein
MTNKSMTNVQWIGHWSLFIGYSAGKITFNRIKTLPLDSGSTDSTLQLISGQASSQQAGSPFARGSAAVTGLPEGFYFLGQKIFCPYNSFFPQRDMK